MPVLLENASSTGDAVLWRGGQGLFTCEGTFGGATVKLQYQTDNGAWLDAGTLAELTSAGGCRFSLPPLNLRAHVDGGTPSGLYAYATHFGFAN